MRLRAYLVLLVLTTLVPLLAFSVFMIRQHGAAYRDAVERDLLQTTRAVSLTLDDHFNATIRSLRGLASSPHLDTGHLRAFHDQARRLQAAHEDWTGVSLFDLSGQRLLYSPEPFGAPLPGRPGAMAARFRVLVETQQPGVSDLFVVPTVKRLGFSVGVPVVRDGQVRYVLSAGIDGAVLAAILARQRVPAGWTLTLMDRQSVIAARSAGPEVVGERAAGDFASHARGAPDGVSRGHTKDGSSAHVAFSRSPRFGWTATLTAPATAVDAAAMRPLWTVTGVGVALVLAGALLALWLGRRVDRSVQHLVREADRLGRGEAPRVVPSVIREAEELSASLAAAGRERARADEEIRARARQQAALAEFGRRALGDADLDVLLMETAHLVAETLAVESVALLERLPDGSALRVRAGVGLPDGMAGELTVPLVDTPAGQTLRTQEPVVIADTREQTVFPVPPHVRDRGIVSSATVPVGGPGGPWGVLGAYATRPQAFGRDDVSFLQALANELGTLIERARAEAERARYAERLRILHEIDRALIAEEAPVAIAEAVLWRLRDLLRVPRAIVNLFDLAAGEVEWLAAVGRRRMHLGGGIRYSLALAGDLEALRRGEPQVMDARALPPSPEVDALLASGIEVYMVVPMVAAGELIGSVSFGGPAGQAFPAEQVGIAQEVATQLAIAIAQARLLERVKQQAAELEERVRERTRELEGANRELEAFGYTVSHDLKTPLRGLEGFARALEEDYAERLDPTGRRYLATIRGSAQRMGQLIDDLLRYSRIERRAVERRPVPLKPLLDQLYEEIAGEVRARGLTIAEDLAVPEVPAEREGLREALANLLSNAVKFSPGQGGAIAVRSYQEGDRVVIAVADRGVGFDMKYHDKIFGIFERLHREEDYPGTGVGLAIVRKVAERHGGRAWAESEVGQGSVFFLALPLS
jgi:signal transduction histidine kinase